MKSLRVLAVLLAAVWLSVGAFAAEAETDTPVDPAVAAEMAKAKLAGEELARQYEAWKRVRKRYRRAAESHKEDVRLAGVKLLADIDHPKAAECLVDHILTDRSDLVAETAMVLLGRLKSDAVLEYVRKALRKKRKGVRQERLFLLAEGVAYMKNPKVLDFLKKCLKTDERELQLIALMGLARFDRLEPDIVPLIAPHATQTKDSFLQLSAIRALARVPEPEAIAPLIESLRGCREVALTAMAVLRYLTGVDFGGNRVAWESWYRDATKGGKTPKVEPSAAPLNTFLPDKPKIPPGQGGAAHYPGGRGDDESWDSSTTETGRRPKSVISLREISDLEFTVPERGTNVSTDVEAPMEIIPLYPGQVIKKATLQQWNQKLEELKANGLDLVILLDTTYSMKGELTEIKKRIRQAVLKLFELVPNTRLSFCAYRDRDTLYKEEYLIRGIELTADPNLALRFLDNVAADGGGDEPEAVDEALNWGMLRNVFRTQATKVMVLVADAPPHREHRRIAFYRADWFRRRKKGRISTIHCRKVIPELMEITRKGGGQAYRLNQHKAVVTCLMILAFGQEYADHVERTF